MSVSRAVQPVWQVAAFARKEATEVLRQPRLLLTMVLGPFLVLAAFGLGYRDTPEPMRTLFVGPEGSPLLDQIESYADGLDDFVRFEGVSHDPDAARQALMNGDVDLIVTVPDQPVDTIMSGDHASITITHTRLDPIQRSAIVFASRLAVDNINGEVLARIVSAGQDAGSEAMDDRDGVTSLLAGPTDSGVAQARASAFRDVLAANEADVDQVLHLDPRLIARPFEADVDVLVPRATRMTDWYVPAALVLVVQQFGVAFGALSFVREKRLGITEVFRVAPVGALPAALGKYLAYLFLGGGVAAALIALVVVAMDLPIVGGAGAIAAVIVLTLIASVGLGFVISLISGTDAQAVQYTMIVLLASLFFSGFFLSADQLVGPAKAIGSVLPVTYAMEALRDAMLRGNRVAPRLFVALGIYGGAMFVLSVLASKRRMGAVT